MSITLKAARVNAGLNQVDACKLLNVSKTTLINWEKGKTYPDVKQLKKIEEIYNVSYGDIIFLADNNA